MNNSHSWAIHHGLQPGDRVITQKSAFGLIKHHSLYVGMDTDWNAWVIENVAGNGVRWTRLDELIQRNGHITGIARYYGTEYQRTAVVNQALARIGLPYDALTYNCEHFVNDVLYGKRQSPQVDNLKQVVGGALTCMLIVAIVRNL
jgi:hypothetical protein